MQPDWVHMIMTRIAKIKIVLGRITPPAYMYNPLEVNWGKWSYSNSLEFCYHTWFIPTGLTQTYYINQVHVDMARKCFTTKFRHARPTPVCQ